MLLDFSGGKHGSYRKQPQEKSGANNGMQDCCRVYPDELHGHADDQGTRRDPPERAAHLPLVPGSHDNRQSRCDEPDLAE